MTLVIATDRAPRSAASDRRGGLWPCSHTRLWMPSLKVAFERARDVALSAVTDYDVKNLTQEAVDNFRVWRPDKNLSSKELAPLHAKVNEHGLKICGSPACCVVVMKKEEFARCAASKDNLFNVCKKCDTTAGLKATAEAKQEARVVAAKRRDETVEKKDSSENRASAWLLACLVILSVLGCEHRHDDILTPVPGQLPAYSHSDPIDQFLGGSIWKSNGSYWVIYTTLWKAVELGVVDGPEGPAQKKKVSYGKLASWLIGREAPTTKSTWPTQRPTSGRWQSCSTRTGFGSGFLIASVRTKPPTSPRSLPMQSAPPSRPTSAPRSRWRRRGGPRSSTRASRRSARASRRRPPGRGRAR